MKRLVLIIDAPDDVEDADIAIEVAAHLPGSDPTCWEWENFWLDVEEGVVSVDGVNP